MVVDTSALVAIMGNEPEQHRFNRMIEAAAATYVSALSGPMQKKGRPAGRPR